MIQPAQRFSYDELHYVGKSYLQTHPGQMASLGWLHGLRPAAIERCRVLEIACGDGNNLLPLAYSLPESHFLGIDHTPGPLAVARQQAATLGLANLRFETLDLLDFPADAGEFDYIIAHGLYSWCPPAVRERLLAVCGAHLAPQGLAFISFNAYPGYHTKELQRQLMLYHLAHVESHSAPEQAQHALEALDFVALSQPEDHPCRTMLLQAREIFAHEIETKGPAGLAWFHHDLLDTYNVPVYAHEFYDQAGRHGLQFVCDASLRVPRLMGFTAETTGILEGMNGNPVVQDQYLDFVLCAPFRQVLLCRAEASLDRTLGPASMRDLYIAGNLTEEPPAPAGPEAGPDAKNTQTFSCPLGKIAVGHPAAKATLRRIGAAWPAAVAVRELEALQAGLGTQEELAEFLLRLCVGRFANFRPGPYTGALTPGERPEASAVARLAAEHGPLVTNLNHHNATLTPPLRHLLCLLDGTRDRAQLLEAMRAWITSGQAARDHAGQGEQDPAPPALDTLATSLEATLQNLANLGLLVR